MIRLFGYPISRKKLALLALDATLFWLCFLSAATLLYDPRWALSYSLEFFYSISIVCLIYLGFFYLGELYEFAKNFRSQKEVLNILLVCGAAFLASAAVIYPNYSLRISRKVFALNGLFVAGAVVASRFAMTTYQGEANYKRRTILLGASELAQAIVEETERNPWLDTYVVALYKPSVNGSLSEVNGLPVVSARDAKLADAVRKYKVQKIILATPLGCYDPLLRECFKLSYEGIEIVRGEDWFEQHTGKVPLKFIDDGCLLSAEVNRPKFYYRKVKRLIDLAISVLGIVLGAPIMATVAAAIYLEDGQPVLFGQERAGHHGKPFRMYKFRTMVANAEPRGQARWASRDDSRLTRVGRFIRKLRLDEMPQLFNVWKGEMSIVGPRPEREVFVREFLNPKPIEIMGRRREDAGRKVLLARSQETLPYYSKRLLVQPGITGWAQVNYPYAGSFEESEIKLMYDLYYLKNMSLTLDCLIMLRTIRVILLGRGAR